MATAIAENIMATIAPQIHQVAQLSHMVNKGDSDKPLGTMFSPKRLALIAHPRAEDLRSEAILVFAGEAFVVLKRVAQHVDDDRELHPIQEGLQAA